MDADGRFVTLPGTGTMGPDRGWDPEEARVLPSRDAARKAAKLLGGGLKVVQLLSVAQWEARYPAVGAAA
jgi:hypothetical protein